MRAGRWLLDTGPVVAYLSRDDAAHERCIAAFGSFQGVLHTTEAVITECMHFSAALHDGPDRCLRFFKRSGVIMCPMTLRRFDRCSELIHRYASAPMDYADATLVALAEESGIGRIFTLDRRGFSIYRWGRDRAFEILP